MRKLRSLVLALALLSMAPPVRAQFQFPEIEEVVPPIAVGTSMPTDLGMLTWRVSGDDRPVFARPSYDDETWIARSAVSPDLLHNRVAWYRFHFVPSARAKGMGSELLVGGLEGNARVYLNGHLLGTIRGAVDPPYRRQRIFRLLPSLIRYDGDNVLAIRLSGYTGQPRVGIPAGPLVIAAFSPRFEDQWRAADAHRASMRVLSPATGSLAFGRMGGGNSNGLLTCHLTPDGFSSATTRLVPTPIAGTFGSPGASDSIRIERLSPVGKVLRVAQAAGPRYRLYYPLLYPGFAVEPLGAPEATLSVHLDGDLDVMYVDRWGVTTHRARVDARIPWAEPWICLYDRHGKEAPLLVALPSPKWPIWLTRAGTGVDVVLPAGAIARFCWPWGLDAHLPRPVGPDMARLRTWSDAMVPFALRSRSQIQDGVVQASDRFDYLPAGSTPYAPLPPVVAAALGHGPALPAIATPDAQPFGLERLLSRRSSAPPVPAENLGVPTLAGPLWAARESAAVSYDLPAPSLDAPGALEATDAADATASPALPPLAGALARSAVDLLFRGRAQAYLAWNRLSDRERESLQANTAYQLPRAWSPASWAESVDPLTGARFAWTEARISGTDRLGGFGLGNGLSLYGTSLAGLYGGNWGLIRHDWPAMRRAFAWFEDSFDWAWQTACDSERGRSTGGRRTLVADYLGALGMARMARVVDPAAEGHYVDLAARMAVLAGDRPDLTAWARRHGLLAPAAEIAGLSIDGARPATGSALVVGSSPVDLEEIAPSLLKQP